MHAPVGKRINHHRSSHPVRRIKTGLYGGLLEPTCAQPGEKKRCTILEINPHEKKTHLLNRDLLHLKDQCFLCKFFFLLFQMHFPKREVICAFSGLAPFFPPVEFIYKMYVQIILYNLFFYSPVVLHSQNLFTTLFALRNRSTKASSKFVAGNFARFLKKIVLLFYAKKKKSCGNVYSLCCFH